MADSDSDSDDSQFASPQAITPTFFNSQPASPGPPLPAALKPPAFSLTPEELPPQQPPSAAFTSYEPISSAAVSTALDSLSKILPDSLPDAVSSSPNPAAAALYDTPTTYSVSCLLRAPNSGSGDSPLCRWFYESFQSGEPCLQLLVLRFVPLLAGVYLARASTQRRHLAGFEAVLLAFYSHQTASRSSKPVTVTLPELSTPSVYHEASSLSSPTKSDPAVVWPALEPYGTVRSTRRACIVGVALDLYYSKICWMPLASKVEFCEFVNVWAGHVDDGDDVQRGVEERIPLPWELLQPALKILGHCMNGSDCGLRGRAHATCRKLQARALYDVNPKAILAIETLLKMVNVEEEDKETDYTELPHTRLLSI